MKCPRCGEDLDTVTYEGVEVETCPGCEGEWLDEGELKAIVDTREVEFTDEERKAVATAVDANSFTHDDTVTSRMKCPKCPDSGLQRFNYAGSTGIALDRCPTCGGIWLDKDELENVRILVEEWEKKQAEDLGETAAELERVKREAEERLKQSGSPYRSMVMRNRLVSAIVDKFFG